HGAPVPVECLGHLHGELPGGDQDQEPAPPRPERVVGEVLQKGQREGRGLAGARCRLAQEIAPLEERGDRGGLDRRGLFIAERGERFDQARAQPETFEGSGHGRSIFASPVVVMRPTVCREDRVPDDPASSAASLGTLRRALHLLLIAGMTGTAAELLLLGHTEDVWQLIPLGLFALAGGLLAWLAVAPSRGGVRALQAVMVLFLV